MPEISIRIGEQVYSWNASVASAPEPTPEPVPIPTPEPTPEPAPPPAPSGPRVGYFCFGNANNPTYRWIDDLGALVHAGDVVIASTGVIANGSGKRNPPNFGDLEGISEFLEGRKLHAVVRTTGDANVAEIAKWIATDPRGKQFRGVMMTYEPQQGDLDFLDPRDDAVAGRKAWLDHHRINRDACKRHGLEFWSFPGGMYLADWAVRLNVPYGEAGAMCDGYGPQFQADVKDGDLFNPKGADDRTPLDRLMDGLSAAKFKGVLMPQSTTLGGSLGNAVTDVDLALRGTRLILSAGSQGVCVQYQVNSEANRTLLRRFLVGLGR